MLPYYQNQKNFLLVRHFCLQLCDVLYYSDNCIPVRECTAGRGRGDLGRLIPRWANASQFYELSEKAHYMPLASHCPNCGAMLEIISRSEGYCPKCVRSVFATSKLAAGVFIERDDQLLLIRRAEEPARGRWDVPGGFLEEGEAPEAGARREIKEELGIDLGALDLFLIDLNDGGESPVVDILFRCTEFEGIPKALEVEQIGWFGGDEMPKDLAFAATERLLSRWRDLRIRRQFRLLDGTILEPTPERLVSRVIPSNAALPENVYVECGEWSMHDGALCGRVDGEQPAALWLKEPVEGDHLFVFRAHAVAPAKGDINAYWEGSGRVLGEGDVACTISGICAFWDKLSGIERHPEGGLRITTRRPPIVPGRVYEIAVGRRGNSDFLFLDGELVVQLDDPNAFRRSQSQVALSTWDSHVHFLEAALYKLP